MKGIITLIILLITSGAGLLTGVVSSARNKPVDLTAADIPVSVSSEQDSQKQTEKPQTEKKDKAVIKQIGVKNLKVNSISVSTVNVTWEAETDRQYDISIEETAPTGYADNIYIDVVYNGKCYINGLRENTRYRITVAPKAKDKENAALMPCSALVQTERVNVIKTYPHEEGWTQCFCGERASGLTLDPSWSAIQGSIVDPVTGTGIRRNEYGDYCCAMGVFYGYCGDRFLVELENGIQFTVKICDSKGYADDGEGKYHWFGGEGNGKCVIEFIYDDNYLPSDVAYSGSWGYYNWKGLNFDNIKTIKRIEYGQNTVSY